MAAVRSVSNSGSDSDSETGDCIDINYSDESDKERDSEADCFSDNDSSNEIIDDSFVVDISPSKYRSVHNSIQQHDDDSYLAEMQERFNSNLDDVEYLELKSALSSLNCVDRLLVVHELCETLDVAYRSSSDELSILSDLPPSRSNGLLLFLESCHFSPSFSESRLSSVVNGLSVKASKCRPQVKDTLDKISRNCVDYFFSVESYTKAEFQNVLTKMVQLFNIDCETVNELETLTVFSNKGEIAVEKKVINIKDYLTVVPPIVPNSLSDLMSYESETIECSQESVIATKKKKITEIIKHDGVNEVSEIVVWRGNNIETTALECYKKEMKTLHRYKDVLQLMYKTSFETQDEAFQVASNIMLGYFLMVQKLHKTTKCSIDACRKLSYDISCANSIAALKFLTTKDERDVLPVVSKKTAIAGMTSDELLAHYPADGTHSLLLRVDKKSDERFLNLPPDWTYKENLPCGIFMDYLQINLSVKNILLVIFGDDNVQKFKSENLDDFVQFNSDSSRQPKNGMWACETCSYKLKNIPVRRVMYVVLSMQRKTQLLQILQEISWFLNAKNISLSECLVETFNNEAHFGQCYKAIDDIMKESEGGFIGMVNEQLRKQLKITDSDLKEQCFKVMVQYFQENNLVTFPACIRRISEISESSYHSSESDREFAKAVSSVLNSGQATCSSVKSAVWWNQELEKYRSPFLKDNKNLLSFKIANDLFNRVNKLFGGCLLDPNVDVTDWDEAVMGPMKYKGTLKQPAILNLIQTLRTEPTDLFYILKINKIGPQHFFNTICKTCVKAGRRSRSLLLTGPKRSGKSVIANALLKTFDGDRVAIDVKNGRDFNLASTTNENVGVVLLEDASKNSLLYMDQQLRPFIDGDEIVVNQKMKATSKGKWRSVVITTNEPENSDSEDEGKMTLNHFTLRKFKVLEKRYKHVQFRTDLSKHKYFVSDLSERDIFSLFWRYGFLPQCNALYNGPRCQFSPCKGPKYNQHHFNCPLVREVISNLKHGVTMNECNEDDCINECFERVSDSNIGLVFDIKQFDAMATCFKFFYQVRDSDLLSCRSSESMQKKKERLVQINHFLEYVWKPICYLSAVMKGDYQHIGACDWAHNHLLNDHLYKPLLEHELEYPSIGDLCNGSIPICSSKEELYCCLKLDWCLTSNERVREWLKPLIDVHEDLSNLSIAIKKWRNLRAAEEKVILDSVVNYINCTHRKKRFKRNKTRNITNWVCSSFDKLFVHINGFVFLSHVDPEDVVVSLTDCVSSDFFD